MYYKTYPRIKTIHHIKREKKLAGEYNRDIAKTVTYIAKQITQIWKIIVIVNTCAIIIITLLQGFEWSIISLRLGIFCYHNIFVNN